MDMHALNQIYYGSPHVIEPPNKSGLDARIGLIFDVVRDQLEATFTAQRLVETGVIERAPSKARKIFDVVVSAVGVVAPAVELAHFFHLAPSYLGELFHLGSEAAEFGAHFRDLKGEHHTVTLRLDQIRAIATEMAMRCAMHYAPDALRLPYHRVEQLATLVSHQFLDELSTVNQSTLRQKGLDGLFKEVIAKVDPPPQVGLAGRVTSLLRTYGDHSLVRHVHLIGRLWLRGKRRGGFQRLCQNLIVKNKQTTPLKELYPGIEGKTFDPVEVNVRTGVVCRLTGGCFAITDKELVPSVVDCLRIVHTEKWREEFWNAEDQAQQVFEQLHRYAMGAAKAPKIERSAVEPLSYPVQQMTLRSPDQLPKSFTLSDCIDQLTRLLPLSCSSYVSREFREKLPWHWWNGAAITSYFRTADLALNGDISWLQIRQFANSPIALA